jgi:hypothetical protein
MASDPWRAPIQDLVLKAAKRAAHYREQATEFREMAKHEPGAKLRADLLDLADKYDGLAHQVRRDGSSR